MMNPTQRSETKPTNYVTLFSSIILNLPAVSLIPPLVIGELILFGICECSLIFNLALSRAVFQTDEKTKQVENLLSILEMLVPVFIEKPEWYVSIIEFFKKNPGLALSFSQILFENKTQIVINKGKEFIVQGSPYMILKLLALVPCLILSTVLDLFISLIFIPSLFLFSLCFYLILQVNFLWSSILSIPFMIYQACLDTKKSEPEINIPASHLPQILNLENNSVVLHQNPKTEDKKISFGVIYRIKLVDSLPSSPNQMEQSVIYLQKDNRQFSYLDINLTIVCHEIPPNIQIDNTQTLNQYLFSKIGFTSPVVFQVLDKNTQVLIGVEHQSDKTQCQINVNTPETNLNINVFKRKDSNTDVYGMNLTTEKNQQKAFFNIGFGIQKSQLAIENSQVGQITNNESEALTFR